MIRWMIDEGHLDEDDDPTIGVRSGKAKASRETGGLIPWTEEDMGAIAQSGRSARRRDRCSTSSTTPFFGWEMRTASDRLTCGKIVRKKVWAMKFKNTLCWPASTRQRELPWGTKARAEVATYAECTESQMMTMFGWTDPKMPAHYIAKANREKLGMDKVVAFDQSQSRDDFLAMPWGTTREHHQEQSRNFPK
jgi:hypothetical protein